MLRGNGLHTRPGARRLRLREKPGGRGGQHSRGAVEMHDLNTRGAGGAEGGSPLLLRTRLLYERCTLLSHVNQSGETTRQHVGIQLDEHKHIHVVDRGSMPASRYTRQNSAALPALHIPGSLHDMCMIETHKYYSRM